MLLHAGCGKSLGVYLAEAEASTGHLMDVLGHDETDHAELFSRKASQGGAGHGPGRPSGKPLLGKPVG